MKRAILCNAMIYKLLRPLFTYEIKRNSSRWIKTLDPYYAKFYWQGGYAGFSISPALVQKTRKYIEEQEEHHKKRTFEEELMSFLKEYGINYDQRYLFTD